MTQYITYSSSANSAGSLALRAVTYPIRVARLDLVSGFDQQVTITLDLYPSSSLSGGSALTINPMRGGSPAATATARKGSISTSGSFQRLTMISLGAAPSGSLGSAISTSIGNYQPALDLILAPGAVFKASGFVSDGSGEIGIGGTLYFEELRLS